MNFGIFLAWAIAIPIIYGFMWVVHLIFGWWGVAIVGSFLAYSGWLTRPAADGDYYIPTEEITIIDKDGNAKTYRKK